MIAAPPPTAPISQMPVVAATVEKCLPPAEGAPGSVTFAAQMTALTDAPEMAVRVALEARAGGERRFHPLSAPGVGAWHESEPSVKVFRYLAQVTNLAPGTSYRAHVSFHWLTAQGHVLRHASRQSAVCRQPPAQGSGAASGVG